MSVPSYGDSDPIAALATVPGESALALIKVSGAGAIELLAEVFSRPQVLLSAPGHSIVHGWIVYPQSSGQEKIDEVLVSVYRAPASYTGEDGADICCHGGIATVKALMTVLKDAGLRPALPGEFSFRAFMNGKLDLTRAESVVELVSSKTNRGRRQAVRRLAGALEKEILEIKTLLVELLAGTEIYLDYSEDEFYDSPSGDGISDEAAGRLPDRALAVQAAARLRVLSDLWRRERIYAEGMLAVIAGRPNAGKSSLFNYLIREDRSIVTDVPGTTRDWIEALISVEDVPLRLADTAGLRTPNPETIGKAERIGMERSLELIDRADMVLYLIDGVEGISKEDRDFLEKYRNDKAGKSFLIIWNKADIAPPHTSAPPLDEGDLPGQLLAVSAKTGEGIPGLMDSIAGLMETAITGTTQDLGNDAAGPGTLRQKELIDASLACVEEALELADREEPLDIIAPRLRAAVNALGEITGEVSSDDILAAMFSRFCVGK